MSQTRTSVSEDLQQLQKQLTEFRNTHPVRSRLPESVWVAATELAKRYGGHRTARVLHLDYVGLKRRVESRTRPETKRTASPSPPTFVELVGPAPGTATSCRIELEATPGTLRLELPAIGATELTNLIRAFLGH
jgi:hypothetical protein